MLQFIKVLFVLDNYISDIKQFDLKSLSSSLETLILAGNSLTSVPEGKQEIVENQRHIYQP